jgi:hypothetical protein
MSHIAIGLIWLTLPWWGWYFARLYYLARQGHLLRLPRAWLWLILYASGLLFYLQHYELEYHLQLGIMPTGLPVMSLLKLLFSSGLITGGYLLIVHRYTQFKIRYEVFYLLSGFMGGMIALNLYGYTHLPYLHLQWLNNALVCSANLLAATALLPMLRALWRSRLNRVQDAHQRWFLLFLITATVAAIFLLLDSLLKLLTGDTTLYTPAYSLSVCFQVSYLLIAVILIGPDKHLDWVYYPAHWRTRRRLQRLLGYIYHTTHQKPIYTLPTAKLPTLSALEFTIYRLFIEIMDSYRLLPQTSSLFQSLQHLENANLPYAETLHHLQQLSREVKI